MSRGPKRGRTESAFAAPPHAVTLPVLHGDADAIEEDAPETPSARVGPDPHALILPPQEHLNPPAGCWCGPCTRKKQQDGWFDRVPAPSESERPVPPVRERSALADAEAEVAALTAQLLAIQRQLAAPMSPGPSGRDRYAEIQDALTQDLDPATRRRLQEEALALLSDPARIALARDRDMLQAQLVLAETAVAEARTIEGLHVARAAKHGLRAEHGTWLLDRLAEMDRSGRAWRKSLAASDKPRLFDEWQGRLADAHGLLETSRLDDALKRVAEAERSGDRGAVARVLVGDPELLGAMTPDGESVQALAVAQKIAALHGSCQVG